MQILWEENLFCRLKGKVNERSNKNANIPTGDIEIALIRIFDSK